MTAAVQSNTQQIVVDEVLPHDPATIWATLTTPELMGRWLMMPSGFSPEPGAQFTYQTKPAGAWDGVIHCEVLEVLPNERLVYAWRGGHPGNRDYGAPLDTVVTFTLTETGGGTRLRLVHSGFQTPANDFAFRGMSEGWPKVVQKIGALSDDQK